MPSTNSSSVVMAWLSSTVITPSLPTFRFASAMSLPISSDWLEIAATWATSSLLSATGTASLLISSTTASTAFSIPILSCIGFAPAVTLRKPSLIMVWATTVADLVGLEFVCGVLGVEHLVADLELRRHLGAVVEDPSGPHCLHDALLRLLLGGVREDEPALGLLLFLDRLDHYAVAQRSQVHVQPSSADGDLAVPRLERLALGQGDC